MQKCEQCGRPTEETVTLTKKWVSHGTALPFTRPLTVACCKSCKGEYLDDRAKYFAVLDETMNTHRDFVRVSGQDGTIYGRPCKGWQTAGELGVPYVVSDRYRKYA